MSRRPSGCCSVVAGIGCEAPANGPAVPVNSLATCFSCGERVCRHPGCSIRITSTVRRKDGQRGFTRKMVRMCSTCCDQRFSPNVIRWARMGAEQAWREAGHTT